MRAQRRSAAAACSPRGAAARAHMIGSIGERDAVFERIVFARLICRETSQQIARGFPMALARIADRELMQTGVHEAARA